jgi:hypothetical protein
MVSQRAAVSFQCSMHPKNQQAAYNHDHDDHFPAYFSHYFIEQFFLDLSCASPAQIDIQVKNPT